MKIKKKDKLNILNITFRNNDELKELLKILGHTIDTHTKFIKNSLGETLKNSDNNPLKYTDLTSVLPGSKIVIEKNDLTAVSRYYNQKINV